MEGPYPEAAYDPQEMQFWPKHLKENGYTTGHVGK